MQGQATSPLMADSAAVQGNTTIAAGNLRISGSAITLGDVQVTTLNLNTGGGAIDVTSSFGFQIANITGAPGAAGVDSGGGNVRLIGSAAITQASGPTGRILANNLTVDPVAANADITLDNPANQVTGTLSLAGPNNVSFTNALATHLGTSAAGGSLKVVSAGDLEIVSGAILTSNAGGDAVVLAAAGNFVNSAGSAALQLTGGGRFLIYSLAPGNDIFGGLNSGNTAVWNTSYPTAITVAGNRYVFASQPIITVATSDLSKIYGTDVSASIAPDYTISGLQAGVANAFLGDTAASVYSGSPSVTSAGAAAGAGASGSPYAISVSAGSFTVMDGYGLTLQNAQLTINPATLTYNAAAASRTYGAANPFLSGTVTGFVNNDTQSSATTGSLAFTTPAAAASNVGSYAINGSGLSASNYIFVQAAGNSAALVINPATLSVALTGTVAKLFDGTTAATLSSANYSALTGIVGGDDVALASFPTKGLYDTPDIGAAKIVTVSGLSLNGAKAADYTIPGTVSGAVGVITAPAGISRHRQRYRNDGKRHGHGGTSSAGAPRPRQARNEHNGHGSTTELEPELERKSAPASPHCCHSPQPIRMP